jgi:hypothetical protein
MCFLKLAALEIFESLVVKTVVEDCRKRHGGLDLLLV